MKKLKVAVFFGGASDEYTVSLKSASAVIENIDDNKYEVVLIGVTKEGDFYKYYGPAEDIIKDKWMQEEHIKKIVISPNRSDHGLIEIDKGVIKKERIDIAFPIIHGRNGEDGRLQGLFELAGIPFVGCSMTSSAICMDKSIAHDIANYRGIKVPKSVVIERSYDLCTIKDMIKDLGYPLFIKPANSGSSIGISKVEKESELEKAVYEAFIYDEKVVAEENIEGMEVGCAIMGDNDLIIGEIDEIEVKNGFFDYEEKYTLKNSQIHVPARISSKLREKVKAEGEKIYRALGCSGYTRIDMFLTDDEEIIFCEANTIPGMTPFSQLPRMMKEAGYSYFDVVNYLIGLEAQKYEKN